MRPAALVLAATTALGCGDRRESSLDSVAPSVAAASPAPLARVADSPALPDPCPRTGKWAACSVEKRLRQSAFVAKRAEGDAPRRPGFSVTPIVYSLGRARLEVFLYDDAREMEKDIAGIDTVLVAPPGTASPWETTPILIRSANLAAVLLTQNARQAERLVLALTAGAPQAY